MKLKFLFATSVISLLILSIVPIYFVAATGSAAINLSPTAGSYKVGQTFNLNISVDPGTEKIDTVRANLTYPADLIEIKSFATSPAFSYQAGSNGFNNTAGTFSWGAGTPGGIKSSGSFGTIVFTVKKAGSAQISLSNTSLALSAGENKFNGLLASASYTLTAPVAAPKTSAKKVQPTKPVVSPQPAQDTSAVVTQIETKTQPQNFVASLINSISFITAMRALAIFGVILIVALLGFTFYKIIQKPLLNKK